MDQDPQDPDADRASQAAQEEYPPSYTGQVYGEQQLPPTAGPYGPPPPGTPPGAPYGPAYGYPYPPVRQPTNTLAILALVFAFVFAPAAIVMGAVARRQIQRSGEDGRGLATAGMVLGIVFTVLTVVWIVIVITIFMSAVHGIDQQNNLDGSSFGAARAYLGL